jgi:hypothetical protein
MIAAMVFENQPKAENILILGCHLCRHRQDARRLGHGMLAVCFFQAPKETYNNLLKSLETGGKEKTCLTPKTFLKASIPILDSCSNRYTCNRGMIILQEAQRTHGPLICILQETVIAEVLMPL